jgi:hypothetical protein
MMPIDNSHIEASNKLSKSTVSRNGRTRVSFPCDSGNEKRVSFGGVGDRPLVAYQIA